MPCSRRQFLKQSTRLIATGSAFAVLTSARVVAAAEEPTGRPTKLAGEVGVTTSSFSGHLVKQPAKGKFTALELPRIMRDELGMKVIDLNTSTLASNDPAYLDRLRDAAEKAGCVLTNLKMNQRGLDLADPDPQKRAQALAEYKRSIDAAARLGCAWARPLPTAGKPDLDLYVAGYRELADYAAERNVQLLIENFGWMESDADAIPRLLKAIDRNVAVSPDTGNWSGDEVRWAGLKNIFPHAATCDFKFRQLDAEGRHATYDLERCFAIGWKSGFRGPWCLEHAHPDRQTLFKELNLIRDRLKEWMKTAG